MKYLLLLLLVGCYSVKKAERDIDKIQRKHPEVLAKKSVLLYPVRQYTDSVKFVKYIDSINEIIDSHIVTIADTIFDTINCNKVKKELRNSYAFIKGLQDNLNNIPYVVERVEDSAKIYLCQSEYSKLSVDRDKYRKRCELFKTLMIWILVLLILSLIGHIIKR
jgi:hypothetical protein